MGGVGGQPPPPLFDRQQAGHRTCPGCLGEIYPGERVYLLDGAAMCEDCFAQTVERMDRGRLCLLLGGRIVQNGGEYT